MNRIWTALWMASCFFLAFSCGSKSRSLPLSERKLADVLLDVHIAEAAAQNLGGKSRDSLLQIYYRDICRIHKIEMEELEKSMAIMREDPNRLTEVYSRINKKLEERRSQ